MPTISFAFCRANLLSESQDILSTIETDTQDIPDARTYLLTLKDIRIKCVVISILLSSFLQ